MMSSNLDVSFRNLLLAEKKVIIKFIRPEPNQFFDVCEEWKFPSRMRLSLSNLTVHKLRPNLQGCANQILALVAFRRPKRQSFSSFTILATIVLDKSFLKKWKNWLRDLKTKWQGSPLQEWKAQSYSKQIHIDVYNRVLTG